jgi:hypothetical protein
VKPVKLRPCVAAFAQLMERALRDNDDKGGWSDCPYDYLLRRLGEETVELAETVESVRWATPMEDRGDVPIFRKVLALGREAADVANFAMMIADNAGALERSPGGRR